MTIGEIFNYAIENWEVLSIPIISAIVGWGTNVLALKMTFYPLEFKGIDIKGIQGVGWLLPPMGWQGIIPSKAASMAAKSVDMITSQLIDVEEQFARINPKVIAKEMAPHLVPLTRRIISETVAQEVPLWKLLSEKRKELVYERAAVEIPEVIEEIMQSVKVNIAEVFDLKAMAIKKLTEDKALLNSIFLKVGEQEFKFIEQSGAYFGFLFGFIQMVIWLIYPAWWQLPVGGLIVGYLTNDLALRMIFQPQTPINIFGFKLQGLFIKRQKEVAKAYAKIIADNIMTMPNISEQIFKGQSVDKMIKIIEKHVSQSVDNTAGFSSSLIKFTTGSQAYENIKLVTTQRVVEATPQYIHVIFDYAKQALDIEHTLREKMGGLPAPEFVGFLRPVFQEDEMKLIIIGAILGMLAGFLQLLIV
jgi:uncharacterized membrane protein YheB (UPF0754 family)